MYSKKVSVKRQHAFSIASISLYHLFAQACTEIKICLKAFRFS